MADNYSRSYPFIDVSSGAAHEMSDLKIDVFPTPTDARLDDQALTSREAELANLSV